MLQIRSWRPGSWEVGIVQGPRAGKTEAVRTEGSRRWLHWQVQERRKASDQITGSETAPPYSCPCPITQLPATPDRFFCPKQESQPYRSICPFPPTRYPGRKAPPAVKSNWTSSLIVGGSLTSSDFVPNIPLPPLPLLLLSLTKARVMTSAVLPQTQGDRRRNQKKTGF